MADIRVKYHIDTDSLAAAQAAMHGLTKEEQASVDAFKKLNSEATKAGKAVDSAGKQGKSSVEGLNSSLKTIGGAIAGYFSVQALISFSKQIIEVTSQFQKFQAVLTNTLGSEIAAKAALQQISDLAAKTNFSVQELTESYIKFANRGIKLTTAELTKLTDLANSTGKSFDQLTETVLDAFTGENERLKEFGITAKKNGDSTKFTFKGITTEVKNTQAAISAYLFSLGELNGVQGSTAKIAATLNGQISNLGDAFDQLLVTIGNGVNGPFSGLISFLTSYVQWVQNALKTTQQFNDELTTTRADKFVERFKTMNEEVQKATVQRLQMYVDAQAELLVVERQAREKAQQEANEAYIGEAGVVLEIQKSAREKELELSLETNIKKIQLIKAYYDEQAKVVTKEESGIISRLQKTLKALEKERELSNSRSRISQINKEIEAGKREMDKLLGQEKEFQLKKLEINKNAQDRDFGLRDIFNRRAKDDADYQKGLGDEAAEYLLRKELEKEEKIRAIRQASFELATEIANGLFELASQKRQAELDDINLKRDAELKRVGDDAQAKAFINAKFDRQEAAIKTKQAQADKQQAIFNVLINTASAVMKQLSVTPLPAGAFLVAAIAAIGAIQAGVIASKPIPKFKDGVIGLDGPGTGTSDSIMARLSKGESVMTAQETDKYRPTLEAMRSGFNPDLLNKVAMMNYDAISKQVVGHGVGISSESIEEAVSKGVAKAMRKIPLNHISMDEKGFKKYVFSGDSVTESLNNIFPR
jgi:hypothetical protein